MASDIRPQHPPQQQLQPQPQQQEQPHQQLFVGVKFFLAQCNKPESVKSLLNEAGAKHINYLSESVTHCIADFNCPEAEEAVELFDKPVVTSTWVHQSLKVNTLLPVEAFSPIKCIFSQAVVAFSRHLCVEDVQALAATLTFYGASVTKNPHKATHLIVPSANSSDLKPDKHLPHHQTLKFVSPDWVQESVKQSCMCHEHLFNPTLLLPPKPPAPPPAQPPPPLSKPASQKPDTKVSPQQTIESVDKKGKNIRLPDKSGALKEELKINDSPIKQQTQCQKISHPQNQAPIPQVLPSQLPRLRAPIGPPRGMPQHKFRPLLPPHSNISPNPQSVLQQRHPTLDVQQPKKVTINYSNQYMKQSPFTNNLDSQPHTPHQFHQNPQHNQMQSQPQPVMQPQYPVQHQNQIQHVVQHPQHQHPNPNQHQVQHPHSHQHHHPVQVQYQPQHQPQHQQYVQTRPQHIQPNQMQPQHHQQHIHVQSQNQPYQMHHQQYVPQQESQVTPTQTYAGHQAQPNYQVHEQPTICQSIPQEMMPMSRPSMRPVQPSYQTHQQIVRPNQVIPSTLQYKTQPDKIYPEQSSYSQFDGGEIVNNVNVVQAQTQPPTNLHWQVVPGSPNRMTQPQHQQFLNSPQPPVPQQLIRQPIVQRPPIGPQLEATVVAPINQQFVPRPPAIRFQQTQQKQVYHSQDRDMKTDLDNSQEKASNILNQPHHIQPSAPLSQPQRHVCPPANVHVYDNSLIPHPSIFNQTQESSMEKIKARVPQVDAEVEYFGHDLKLNIPQDAPFTGCRFKFIGYSSVDPILRAKWIDSVKVAGGQFEDTLDQATHLICENRLGDDFSEALKRGIRCVTIYWISDVLGKNKMTYPWKALHIPIPFDKSDKPLKDQIIAITNIKGRERREVKEMILRTGARFTEHFSSSNTLIICGNVGGNKYERALEWGVSIANCRLVSDILLKGDFNLSRMLTAAKYQLFNVNDPLKIYTYHDIRDLMKPWTKPITISESTSITLKNPINGITMSTINSNDDSGIATGSNNSDQEVATTSDKQNCNDATIEIEQSKSIPEDEATKLKTESESVPQDAINSIVPKEIISRIKPKSTRPIKILFTHLSSSLLEKLEKCASKLGLALADNPINCTHLVVDRISRTPKFIMAFSRAEYILSYKWLIESNDANDLLDEKYFLLQDKEGEELYSLNLVYSLMKRKKRHGLLFNNLVFFVTPTVVTTVSNVKEMIESAGGIVAIRKPPSKLQVEQLRSEGKRLVVITCDDDSHICAMFDFSDVELVDKEFVISGILRQDIDYDSHRIKFKTPPNKPPSQLSAPSPPKKIRFDNSFC